jgi:hypothetical protein
MADQPRIEPVLAASLDDLRFLIEKWIESDDDRGCAERAIHRVEDALRRRTER